MKTPPLADILTTLHVVRIPMRVKFRGITTRDAALFEGPEGWTEFSPFPEYDDAEAATWLRAAVDWGWIAQPETLRDRVAVNATVPAVAADEVAAVLARFDGCAAVKVKVAEAGQSLDADLARLRAVRAALPDAALRVDANGAWSVAEAVTALTAFAPFGLQYAEQPVASVAELAAVREQLRDRGVSVPIAADESVRKASDPLRVARAGAADVIIVKAQPLGGVSRALEVVQAAGLPAVVSSALDTSVGIALGAHLAAALPEELSGGASGLGTVNLFHDDVATRSLVPHRGEIPVGRPEVSEQKLTELAAPDEVFRWWRERIIRCHALL